MHATYNKVNETCPNHNRHYFNVLLYMPCLVSKDHWHLSVLFAPVECKFECECECKQSNCNIFRIARIHIAKPIHIFYIECISYVQIMKTFQSQMRCTFFMMRKLNIYSWHMSNCVRPKTACKSFDPNRSDPNVQMLQKLVFSTDSCNFSLYFNVAVVIAWKCRIDSQWKSPNCFKIVRKKPVSYCYIVKRLKIDWFCATF